MRRWLVATSMGALLLGAAGGAAVAQLGGSTEPDEDATADVGLLQEEDPASPEGAERRARAMAFVEAMRTWTACIAAMAPLHDESTGEFDPVAACGEKPAPPNEDGEDGEEDEEGNGEDDGNGTVPDVAADAARFGLETAARARAEGEAFGRATAGEAQAGGEAFGQTTAEAARPQPPSDESGNAENRSGGGGRP